METLGVFKESFKDLERVDSCEEHQQIPQIGCHGAGRLLHRADLVHCGADLLVSYGGQGRVGG